VCQQQHASKATLAHTDNIFARGHRLEHLGTGAASPAAGVAASEFGSSAGGGMCCGNMPLAAISSLARAQYSLVLQMALGERLCCIGLGGAGCCMLSDHAANSMHTVAPP
jgi:hypothetical protein